MILLLRHSVCTRYKQLASHAPIGLRTEKGRKGCLAAATPFAAVVRRPRREGRRAHERRRRPSFAPGGDQPMRGRATRMLTAATPAAAVLPAAANRERSAQREVALKLGARR